MAVLTSEQYIESLRKQKPRVFMAGEEVKNIVDHPRFKLGINNIRVCYECANDPKYADLATTISPYIDERIPRWNHIVANEQDVIAKIRLLRKMGDYLSFPYRCIGADLLATTWAVSYDIDKKYNTGYHERVINFVKEAQRKDWTIGCAAIDPKGDRSLRPGKQADPDMHLHIQICSV